MGGWVPKIVLCISACRGWGARGAGGEMCYIRKWCMCHVQIIGAREREKVEWGSRRVFGLKI